MPTYSRLTINLSPSEEMQVKQIAKEKGKSVSAYCRGVLLGEQEQPISRASVESEIDELKKAVEKVNKNIMILSRHILYKEDLNCNLLQSIIDSSIESDELKKMIYDESKNATDEFIRSVFGE